MTAQEVEYIIRRMILESKSGFNDGWTQDYYRKELMKLLEIIQEGIKK